MKVTVILEPNYSKVAITVESTTATFAPMKPTGGEVMGAIRAAADEATDRAMELGFINAQ